MGFALGLARTANRLLPFGWRVYHPTALPVVSTEPGPDPAPPPPPTAEARLYALLDANVAITQLHDGHYVFVDPKDEQVAPHLIARGYWERWVETAVRRLIQPGAQIIEIGANLGYYTLIMARDVGERGHIHSYEPNPRLAPLVRRSVEFNGYGRRVTVHEKAASDSAGSLSFLVSRTNSGAGTLAQGASWIGDDTATIEVEAVRLDEMHPQGVVDMIRCDAEGAEGLILEGAAGIIRRSPDIKLCLEWNLPMLMYRCDVKAMLATLKAQGFAFWRILEDASLKSISETALLEVSGEVFDIVAARRLRP